MSSDVWVMAFADNAERTVQGLQDVFGIDAATARRVFDTAPITIKRGCDEATAASYQEALEQLGARVRVLPTGQIPSTAPPGPPRPSASLPPASLENLAPPTFDHDTGPLHQYAPPTAQEPSARTYEYEGGAGGRLELDESARPPRKSSRPPASISSRPPQVAPGSLQQPRPPRLDSSRPPLLRRPHEPETTPRLKYLVAGLVALFLLVAAITALIVR